MRDRGGGALSSRGGTALGSQTHQRKNNSPYRASAHCSLSPVPKRGRLVPLYGPTDPRFFSHTQRTEKPLFSFRVFPSGNRATGKGWGDGQTDKVGVRVRGEEEEKKSLGGQRPQEGGWPSQARAGGPVGGASLSSVHTLCRRSTNLAKDVLADESSSHQPAGWLSQTPSKGLWGRSP